MAEDKFVQEFVNDNKTLMNIIDNSKLEKVLDYLMIDQTSSI